MLELEEAIRTLWLELQGLDETERIPSLPGTTTVATLLRSHAPWNVPLIVSELDPAHKEWWGVKDCVIEKNEEVNMDAVTQLPIEDPVCLPSGQYVDRSTYDILRQTTGKDPFNMVPID